MSRPHRFVVGGRVFCLYPETLGSSLLVAPLLRKMDVSPEELGRRPFGEILRISRADRRSVASLIALATSEGKAQLLDNVVQQKRSRFFLSHLSDCEMAELLMLILIRPSAASLLSATGLDREQQRQRIVARIRERSNGNTVTFGGHTPFGLIVDAACQRYGWTYDYVVWTIPSVQLQMMMADAVNTLYLSDEERRKLAVAFSPEDDIIDGDTADIETLRQLTKD